METIFKSSRVEVMNINETLAAYFECESVIKSASDKETICNFLKIPIKDKHKCVTQLIQKLVKRNNKDKLYLHISELYDIEYATMVLTENRDHVIHASNTYLLGLYINDKCLDSRVDEFQWKLAALFHDISYPIVISQQIIERYINKMGEIKNKLAIENINPVISLVPNNFEKLANEKNAFDYIQKRIDEWGLVVDIRGRYKSMISTNKINHGMISALTVLHLIDSMYQKKNPERDHRYTFVDGSDWNQQNFENDVVSACSAIFLHDLDDDAFNKIDKKKAPLPYLLKLCDELQNWDRPKQGEELGDSPENYAISIQNGNIFFDVNCSDDKDKNKIDRIKDKIKCLNDSTIIVRHRKMTQENVVVHTSRYSNRF